MTQELALIAGQAPHRMRPRKKGSVEVAWIVVMQNHEGAARILSGGDFFIGERRMYVSPAEPATHRSAVIVPTTVDEGVQTQITGQALEKYAKRGLASGVSLAEFVNPKLLEKHRVMTTATGEEAGEMGSSVPCRPSATRSVAPPFCPFPSGCSARAAATLCLLSIELDTPWIATP